MFDFIYARAILLYIAAGLAEIGGGWLVWQWLREERGLPFGLLGGAVLFGYGVIHTLQSELAFGRVYALYGAIFIVIALVWGWAVDEWQPDFFDLLGAAVVLVGVTIMLGGRR
jgi:small multidrug resistance family-3 protein